MTTVNTLVSKTKNLGSNPSRFATYMSYKNKEKRKRYILQYTKEHQEERKEYYKKWILTDIGRISQAKYDQSEKGKIRHIKYSQTLIGKTANIRKASKHRQLYFFPLNKPFENYEAHHISLNFIIYIPKKIHQSIAHNIWTWKNMDKINQLAIGYL